MWFMMYMSILCAVSVNLKSTFILAHVQFSFWTDQGKRPMSRQAKAPISLKLRTLKMMAAVLAKNWSLLKMMAAVLARRLIWPPSAIKELVLGTKIFELSL